MEIDFRRLGRRVVEAEVCVIGAGPAGLALAREFIGGSHRLVLLESGDGSPSPAAQALCGGTTAGDPYASPSLTRHRQAGGTAHLWNTWVGDQRCARLAPLDAIDFEERDWVAWSGWPFSKPRLDPFYDRARRLWDLDPADCGEDGWPVPDPGVASFLPELLETGVFRLGPARPFTETILEEVRQAPNVSLFTRTTVLRLFADGDGRTVTHVRAFGPGGVPLMVRAPCFVVAAGGIESARLLLLSGRGSPSRFGNDFDLLGRFFMDHPRDFSCTLVPDDPGWIEECGFYDVRCTGRGIVMGRLGLRGEVARAERLLGASVVLRPRRGRSGPPLLRRLGRWASHGDEDDRAGSGTAEPRRHEAPYCELQLNLEQAPDPENRITLGDTLDAHGQPRVEVRWRWREADRASLARLTGLLARAIARSGIGRLDVAPNACVDPNAHHHLGATRMDRDPRRGVVDENSRVHGLSNLFVAGSSVFPTGGSANPTFTLVALAIRLADHLKEILRRNAEVSAVEAGEEERRMEFMLQD